MITKLDHLVITTKRPKECLEFYKKLGFTAVDANGRFELFAGDFKINVHVSGKELLPHARHVCTGSADLCFEVENELEDFLCGLLETGFKTETGIVERHGAGGEMHSFYMRDPDGNLLEFCSYRVKRV